MARLHPERCFHCSADIPPSLDIRLDSQLAANAGAALVDSGRFDAEQPAFCCYGCKAVAELILSTGLGRFYQHLDAPLQRPNETAGEDPSLSVYDREDLLSELASSIGSGVESDHYSIRLSLTGITCAACVWLLEHAVGSMPGVSTCLINLSTHEAHIDWHQDTVRLSQLIGKIRQLGYDAAPFGDDEQAKTLRKQQRTDLLRLGLAGIGTMQAMMLAIPIYTGLLELSGPAMLEFFRIASVVIATPVVFFSARPFFDGAKRSLLNALRLRSAQHLTMDVPVALAIALAYSASLLITWRGGNDVYFDSVCMFTFFLLLGRYFEQRTRLKMAQDSARISQRRFVLYQRVDPATLRPLDEVLLRDMAPGDVILLKGGQLIPFDGEVCAANDGYAGTDRSAGIYHVNEAALTGEFAPQSKRTGEKLMSGSVVIDTPVPARVGSIGGDSYLSTIDRLVNRALSERPEIARLADRISGIFVSVVLLVTVLVYIFWLLHDPSQPLHAFEIALSVLVITCPCALSLATPAALTSASNALRSLGFIITRGHTIETLARVDTAVFDKTGTLTYGRLSLRSQLSDLELQLAAMLGAHSEHPVSRAVCAAAEAEAAATALPDIDSVTVTAGDGVAARLDGGEARLGRREFALAIVDEAQREHEIAAAQPQLEGNEQTEVWLVCRSDSLNMIRCLLFDDELRQESPEVIKQMQQALGIDCHLISGDRSQSVASVAAACGITTSNAACTPDMKLSELQTLNQSGITAMIGDGINDLPAMACAHVSIAMHEASDLTRIKADALLGAGRLGALPAAFSHARLTLRIIRQNITWALMYNALALPLAIAGFVPPWLAAIGMSLSSLLVVCNAMRLRKITPGFKL